MKYNSKQKKRIAELELKLSGELQKSVWATIRENGEYRLVHLSQKLGRRNDSIFTAVKKLVEYNLIESVSGKRGTYNVSNYILTGELK